MKITKAAVAVMILAGIGLMVTAFLGAGWQLSIASGMAGLGFICLGVIQLKQARNTKRDEERFERIMSKLNEMQQELEKAEQPQNKGVAIADVISSGLKYYAEHMAKPKKEEEND